MVRLPNTYMVPDFLSDSVNPLFINYKDVTKAVQTLTDILQHEKWNEPQFKTKNFVT